MLQKLLTCGGAVSSFRLWDRRLVVCSLRSYALWVNFVRCCILHGWLGSSGSSDRIRCPYWSSGSCLCLMVCFALNSRVITIGCLPCVLVPLVVAHVVQGVVAG